MREKGEAIITATQLSDDNYNSASTTFILSVLNSAPVSNDMSLTVIEQVDSIVNLNVFDIDNDELEVIITESPVFGNVSINNENIIYTSASDTATLDSLKYKVVDTNGVESNISTISISITPVNDAPVMSSVRELDTLEDTSVEVELFASDVEGDNLTYIVSTEPLNGSATIEGNQLTYTPNYNYSGTDIVLVKANDGELDSNIVEITIDITTKSQILNFDDLAIIYGNNKPLGATTNSIAPIVYTSKDPSIVSVDSSTGVITAQNVGETTVYAAVNKLEGYSSALDSIVVKVDKRTITVDNITINDKVYDGTTAATANMSLFSYTGLISSDSVSFDIQASYSNANSNEDIPVIVDISLIGSDKDKYIVSNAITPLASITPKQVVVSGIEAEDRVYDGTKDVDIITDNVVYDGLLNNDQISIATTGVFKYKNANDNAVVVLSSTYTGDNLSNYQIVSQETTTATISRKEINVTGYNNLDTAYKIYDGSSLLLLSDTNPTYTVSDEFIANDVFEIKGVPVFDNANAGERIIKQGSINLSGTDATNYILNWSDGHAIIGKKPLNVVVQKHTKFEGGEDPELKDVIFSGLLDVDTQADFLNGLTIERLSSSNEVGLYTKDLKASGLESNNYDVTYINGDYEIIPQNQLLLQIIPVGEVVFGDNNATYQVAASYASDGVLYELPVSYDPATGIYSINQQTSFGTINVSFTFDTNVVSKNIIYNKGYSYRDYFSKSGDLETGVFSLQPSSFTIESDFLNDEVSYKGEVEIKPKEVSVSVNAITKQYDGNTRVPIEAIITNGLNEGDDVSLSYVSYYNNEIAGENKTVVVEGIEIVGQDAQNYILESRQVTSENASITKKPLEVSGINISKVYDGNPITNFEVSYSGFISGEDESLFRGNSNL